MTLNNLEGITLNYIIRQTLHAIWESLSIRYKLSIEISVLLQPTVIHINILIARSCVSFGHYYVRHSPEELVATRCRRPNAFILSALYPYAVPRLLGLTLCSCLDRFCSRYYI